MFAALHLVPCGLNADAGGVESSVRDHQLIDAAVHVLDQIGVPSGVELDLDGVDRNRTCIASAISFGCGGSALRVTVQPHPFTNSSASSKTSRGAQQAGTAHWAFQGGLHFLFVLPHPGLQCPAGAIGLSLIPSSLPEPAHSSTGPDSPA